ncbi:hypothetical protein [Sphingopyxis panaciterrulae]|uniref:Ribbon-helix-helix protein CopG domain-containing protein n=1 Tax=Sphingopyxis panaciterrulae TaxID=462372 RepID=A0A7W9B6U2_9SPHN|nr:hypothetical protein [Sphingopyxis panaciterrulae]MBB5707349.1 hypothetical protein [Sphingopyxis panaciterrulae]
MARFSLRLDDALYDRLLIAADAADTTPSAYVRDLLERLDGADPFGFHAHINELHSTVIQMLAILATDVGRRDPESLAKGMEDTRRLLLERGLITPEDLPGAGGGTGA